MTTTMTLTKTAADKAKPAQKDAIALLKADHEAVAVRKDELLAQAA